MFSVIASLIESQIVLEIKPRSITSGSPLQLWWKDFLDGISYLKGERGLLTIFSYMAFTNGAAMGYSPILVAHFSTTPGLSAMLYSFFSVAEFSGRTLGGIVHYKMKIPEKKRFDFAFLVYQIYEIMDMILLWIPYPFMLTNRAICGLLGINSASMRMAAVQRYIPESYRSRVNAFQEALVGIVGGMFALGIGLLGELVSYKLTVSITAIINIIVCWCTIWRKREHVRKIYNPNT